MKVICDKKVKKLCSDRKCSHAKPHDPIACGYGGSLCFEHETPCFSYSDQWGYHYAGFQCYPYKKKEHKEDILKNHKEQICEIMGRL